jgi:hypothetical protein
MPELGQSAPHASNLPINKKWDEKINELESRDRTIII